MFCYFVSLVSFFSINTVNLSCVNVRRYIINVGRKFLMYTMYVYNKGNNKITELRTILQRESQNS
jgi:chloramphenicol O-acetyltransferase